MATVTHQPADDGRRATRDSLIVAIGGQVERALGTLTALAMRWGLPPEALGVYTGLRLYLDNTNRSSLGVAAGAAQEIPILLASGREAEAERVTDVAHATNTVTCVVFAAGLLAWAWVRSPLVTGTPLADEWTWGLAAVAGLALLKRHQDFLIVVLRARKEFALTTRLAILDAILSAVLTAGGIWLAGFWGLLASVGLLLVFNIIYLRLAHPLRLGFAWDLPAALRLMRVGLPIWTTTTAFGFATTVDRALILWLIPDGTRAAGLYTVAIMGTSWALDLAGRVAIVIYPYFQTTIGRTGDVAAVAEQAARVAEGQAVPLAAGSAFAAIAGPVVLGALMPQYVEGVPAIRPLLPGMVALGLSWPARQMLIAVGRPYRLLAATCLGLAITVVAGSIGAVQSGIVGVAAGSSVGFFALYLATTWAAFRPFLGWWGHQARTAREVAPFAASAWIAAAVPIVGGRWVELAARLTIVLALMAPLIWRWGRRHDRGGVFRRSGRSSI